MRKFNETKSQNQQTEQEFLQKSCKLLDDSCDSLDGYTLSRLNTIHHAALSRHRSKKRVLLPLGGMLSASVLVFFIFNSSIVGNFQSEQIPVLERELADDIDVFLEAEELEFFEEYEFYQWLADNGAI